VARIQRHEQTVEPQGEDRQLVLGPRSGKMLALNMQMIDLGWISAQVGSDPVHFLQNVCSFGEAASAGKLQGQPKVQLEPSPSPP